MTRRRPHRRRADTAGQAFEEHARDGSTYRLRLVWHPLQAYDWYYNVVANPVLWFAQHYLWNLASSPDWDQGLHHAWHNGYVPVNASFADVVLDELEREPDAAVFFHDYHLYVAPSLVRAARAGGHAGALRAHPLAAGGLPGACCPRRFAAPCTTGILANDVVGFHTARLARQLPAQLRGDRRCGRRLRDGTRSTTTAASLAPTRGRSRSIRSSSRSWPRARTCCPRRQLSWQERHDYLVLRVDRTDPSKNVVRGLRAYELFLEAHPELHGRVQMLALLDPSRQDIPEYAEYLAAIQRAARTVNDRFQTADWTPLDLQIADNFPQSVAAYKQYDVLLVNAIFDGMNLVAKEAPLVNERDGVLILSENAGAHEELGEWALTVNPFDVAGQADAIHDGLVMPLDERRRRLGGIRQRGAGVRHRALDRRPARRPRG